MGNSEYITAQDDALEALLEQASADADEYDLAPSEYLHIWQIGLTVYLADRESPKSGRKRP
jgi:hypothetical protein